MDEVFAPPGAAWQAIAPAYATVLRIRSLITLAVLTAGATVPVWLLVGPLWGSVVIAVGVAWAVWQWFRIPRWVRAWGYAEQDSDLYLRHGLWFRELTVVPYGRMQAVKVESGPLSRRLGLANVQLVTASSQTGATIPGLARPDAEQLRDRLIAIGVGDEDDL